MVTSIPRWSRSFTDSIKVVGRMASRSDFIRKEITTESTEDTERKTRSFAAVRALCGLCGYNRRHGKSTLWDDRSRHDGPQFFVEYRGAWYRGRWVRSGRDEAAAPARRGQRNAGRCRQ